MHDIQVTCKGICKFSIYTERSWKSPEINIHRPKLVTFSDWIRTWNISKTHANSFSIFIRIYIDLNFTLHWVPARFALENSQEAFFISIFQVLAELFLIPLLNNCREISRSWSGNQKIWLPTNSDSWSKSVGSSLFDLCDCVFVTSWIALRNLTTRAGFEFQQSIGRNLWTGGGFDYPSTLFNDLSSFSNRPW